LAHPSAGASEIVPKGDVCVAVGPEGGFTDSEIDAAHSAGWRLVSLGPRVLRVETAALALAALLAIKL
jgi:16S rRNA (uracil1498-N3)-methyltransferase